MGLKGSAFLAIWHDIAEGEHGEFIEWHTREHMPERLSIPGFLTGKRLHLPSAERYVYGTVYAAEDVEVFRSPAYLERLNNPTPWTAAVAPSFRNFLRIACERIAHAGHGDGGTMAMIRFDYVDDGAEAKLRASGQKLVEAVLALRGVNAVHLGVARSEVSAVKTRETELRAKMSEKAFSAVLLVEGSSTAGLEAAFAEAKRLALATGALENPAGLIYETAFSLTDEDMRIANSKAAT